MIKTLSYTEVQKFHVELAKEMLTELRNSDSSYNATPVENIDWCYSVDTVDDQVDFRIKRVDIDKSIRREKLLKLDASLRGEKIEKGAGGFFSMFTKEKEEKRTISAELKDFFDDIAAISLMIKVGEYERFEIVEKTTLFESKIKEEMGAFSF
jgi:hypothetical protein